MAKGKVTINEVICKGCGLPFVRKRFWAFPRQRSTPQAITPRRWSVMTVSPAQAVRRCVLTARSQ